MTAPTFDRAAWRVPPERLLAASCVVAFAAAQWQVDWSPMPWTAHAIGVLLVLEAVLLSLPWSLPRDHRGAAGFVAESVAGLIVPIGAVVVLLVAAEPRLSTGAAGWWYVVAFGFGVVLLLLGGVTPRGLFGGRSAFLLGPTPRSHGVARAACCLVSPPGEEAVFRGVVLVAPPGAALPLAMLGAVAFVARHRVQPGDNGRGATRAFVVEAIAATGLLTLTVCSGSLWPALLSHLVNNVPLAMLQLQRAPSKRRTPLLRGRSGDGSGASVPTPTPGSGQSHDPYR